MGTKIVSDANAFVTFLKSLQDENKDIGTYMDDISVLVKREQILQHIVTEKKHPAFVCEKAQTQCDPEDAETSGDGNFVEEILIEQDVGPQPLSIMKARQLLSWYTMAHNPIMTQVKAPQNLYPLWVRCDKLDPCATAWLGAESIYIGNKTSALKLYTVCCKGPIRDETDLKTLEELKKEHQNRHHTCSV
ncbi:hypothetical protein DNTS_030874 [Danionella cerebrum]|uniref:Protein zwilch n=1 Tax=Danionella cerebrum TaxID=2873325 RepID=A0A553RMU7_9TELE|nr:hypothetical protein DNTS_030874 [Danionella translucida]